MKRPRRGTRAMCFHIFRHEKVLRCKSSGPGISRPASRLLELPDEDTGRFTWACASHAEDHSNFECVLLCVQGEARVVEIIRDLGVVDIEEAVAQVQRRVGGDMPRQTSLRCPREQRSVVVVKVVRRIVVGVDVEPRGANAGSGIERKAIREVQVDDSVEQHADDRQAAHGFVATALGFSILIGIDTVEFHQKPETVPKGAEPFPETDGAEIAFIELDVGGGPIGIGGCHESAAQSQVQIACARRSHVTRLKFRER